MSKYKISGFFLSVLLVFSIFTLLSISEVNAQESQMRPLAVSANGYENTIMIESFHKSNSEIFLMMLSK